MIPEIGKWYIISYGTEGSKSAYHGKAKCMREYHAPPSRRAAWYFRSPQQTEDVPPIAYMIFEARDVKKETTPEPTYEELKEEIERLKRELIIVQAEAASAEAQLEHGER